ncbi:hypothetical protein [Agaribacterium sp. ZY112]|uniref:hypothetical protein n=1 Tax=Agaribacterium sp. ZY112 TaxID=3233574 RepID=UPI003523F16B
MYRACLKTFAGLLVLLVAYSPWLSALDEDRLWLPTNYERLYLDLKASAEAAERVPRCKTVIRGTLDLEQSEKNKPIFRIQCRQENGRTYNELVDGTSYQTLTTPYEEEKELTEEEKQALAAEQERLRLLAIAEEKEAMHASCMRLFKERTALFDALVLVDEGREPEQYESGTALFRFQFDAVDVYKQALKYSALCQIEEGLATKLVVRKRRAQDKNQAKP